MDEIEVETEHEPDLEAGLEKLERPPNGDFVAGLKSFIEWVNKLMDK
ncbi:MAG: hypothetical protein KW802_01145 [Candidatus Doudnabacteria bacterium]|nr:hypothetical protein [Candidatus Doudnabacteria bacterium]